MLATAEPVHGKGRLDVFLVHQGTIHLSAVLNQQIKQTSNVQRRTISEFVNKREGFREERRWWKISSSIRDWMELLKKRRVRLNRALPQRVAARRRYASKPNPAPTSATSANVLGSGTIVIVNEFCGRLLSMKLLSDTTDGRGLVVVVKNV
jgi:hypothetical protein